MTAQIIQFPRMKPLEWEEMPKYWGLVDRRYYDMDIEDGMSPDDAFRKRDLIARAPNPLAGLQYRDESDEEYIVRLESIALPQAQAEKRGPRY